VHVRAHTPPRLVRSRLAWPLVVPLLVFGLAAGHELSYRLTVPHGLRGQELAATGHGYLDYLPMVLALALTLVGAAFAWLVFSTLRRRDPGVLPAWVLLAVPLVAFALQEHLERTLFGGAFPWELAGTRTFQVGLLLQVPFGVAAVLVARLFESLALRVARALGRARPPRRRGALQQPGFAAAVSLPRLRPLALACSERGPPPAA
jgi:hypothetical protein